MNARYYAAMTTLERRTMREGYIKEQDGKCWYCQEPLTGKSKYAGKPVNWERFPPNFLRWPVHLHHDHKTGLTIGAVHAYCNAVSFDYDESPVGVKGEGANGK